MNSVEIAKLKAGVAVDPLAQRLKRVHLYELERVVRLRYVIDPEHVEADTLVAHRAPTRPAEQIEQARARHSPFTIPCQWAK